MSIATWPDTFAEETGAYRRELLAHCYRMLGSIDDAEDAVQEAMARAWNGRATFTRTVSLRAWLYRIATNVCLDQIERRGREPGAGQVVIDPIPEDLLDPQNPSPEARYDAHESISLAFLAALQLLSPRQRAVMILRDVLAWRAAEVAELLGVSVPATNSTLNRARAALARTYVPVGADPAAAVQAVPGRLRALLDRYVRAWEAADVAGLVMLLREDAVVAMPPAVLISGRAAIAEFLAASVFDGGREVRLRPVASNAGVAYLLSSRRPTSVAFEPYCVLVVDTDATDPAEPAVARMTVFVERRVVERFVEG